MATWDVASCKHSRIRGRESSKIVHVIQHQVDRHCMYIYYQSLWMFNIQKPSTTCVQIQALGHWNALTLLLWEMTWSLKGIHFHMLNWFY